MYNKELIIGFKREGLNYLSRFSSHVIVESVSDL